MSVASLKLAVASASRPSSVQIAAQHFMESESGTAVGKESMRPQSADLEQSCHWLARRHVTSLLNSDWLPSLCLRWCKPTSHLLAGRAGPAPLYSRDSDRKLALRRRRWIMTLAGFMRGGGGSTNMRLSRRHCWLPSRVAQQQSCTAAAASDNPAAGFAFPAAAAAGGPPRLGVGGWKHHPASLCRLGPICSKPSISSTQLLIQIDQFLLWLICKQMIGNMEG